MQRWNIKLLNELLQRDLDQETVNYLCEKATSKKHWCEIRSDHVKILLLNRFVTFILKLGNRVLKA